MISRNTYYKIAASRSQYLFKITSEQEPQSRQNPVQGNSDSEAFFASFQAAASCQLGMMEEVLLLAHSNGNNKGTNRSKIIITCTTYGDITVIAVMFCSFQRQTCISSPSNQQIALFSGPMGSQWILLPGPNDRLRLPLARFLVPQWLRMRRREKRRRATAKSGGPSSQCVAMRADGLFR